MQILPASSDPDAPYALASVEERQRRSALLTRPHMQPLTSLRQRILAACGAGFDVPHFDPCDGGIGTKALFLLEAPGPKAVGSTFISRNNPDPTAKNLCALMTEAGIPRTDTLLWNVVPYYVGEAGRVRAVRPSEIQTAMPFLRELIGLLPHLQMIVLLGKKAQSAAADIGGFTDQPIVKTHHPSARVFNVWPEKRAEALRALREVAAHLTSPHPGNLQTFGTYSR